MAVACNLDLVSSYDRHLKPDNSPQVLGGLSRRKYTRPWIARISATRPHAPDMQADSSPRTRTHEMSWNTYIALSLVMFFEYAVWGAWAPVLAARLAWGR